MPLSHHPSAVPRLTRRSKALACPPKAAAVAVAQIAGGYFATPHDRFLDDALGAGASEATPVVWTL